MADQEIEKGQDWARAMCGHFVGSAVCIDCLWPYLLKTWERIRELQKEADRG